MKLVCIGKEMINQKEMLYNIASSIVHQAGPCSLLGKHVTRTCKFAHDTSEVASPIVDTMEMIPANNQEILEMYNVGDTLHIIEKNPDVWYVRKGSTLPFEEVKHVDLTPLQCTYTCNNGWLERVMKDARNLAWTCLCLYAQSLHQVLYILALHRLL